MMKIKISADGVHYEIRSRSQSKNDIDRAQQKEESLLRPTHIYSTTAYWITE